MDILSVFEEYIEELDEKFGDDLLIEYENFTFPTFKILYDETVDTDLLMASIPKEWLKLEKARKIVLDIREYTEDCSEHLDAIQAINISKCNVKCNDVKYIIHQLNHKTSKDVFLCR